MAEFMFRLAKMINTFLIHISESEHHSKNRVGLNSRLENYLNIN